MAFYLSNYPRLIQHRGTPVITYVIESWLVEELDSVESFVQETLERNAVVSKDCLYGIAFPWKLRDRRMLDLWVFTKNHVHDSSGPLARIHIFSEFEPEKALEIASGSTLLVLGVEEQHRRESKDLALYLQIRPTLPDDLVVS